MPINGNAMLGISHPRGAEKARIGAKKEILRLEQKAENPQEELVCRFTKLGECVVDIFAGTGSAGIAAAMQGRVSLLADNDPACVAAATEHIKSRMRVRYGEEEEVDPDVEKVTAAAAKALVDGSGCGERGVTLEDAKVSMHPVIAVVLLTCDFIIEGSHRSRVRHKEGCKGVWSICSWGQGSWCDIINVLGYGLHNDQVGDGGEAGG